jgi:hypothetical protein
LFINPFNSRLDFLSKASMIDAEKHIVASLLPGARKKSGPPSHFDLMMPNSIALARVSNAATPVNG